MDIFNRLWFHIFKRNKPTSTMPEPKFDYSEHIRQKLNRILEIEDGSNYWEFKNKTKDKELLIKKYLER